MLACTTYLIYFSSYIHLKFQKYQFYKKLVKIFPYIAKHFQPILLYFMQLVKKLNYLSNKENFDSLSLLSQKLNDFEMESLQKLTSRQTNGRTLEFSQKILKLNKYLFFTSQLI